MLVVDRNRLVGAGIARPVDLDRSKTVKAEIRQDFGESKRFFSVIKNE